MKKETTNYFACLTVFLSLFTLLGCGGPETRETYTVNADWAFKLDYDIESNSQVVAGGFDDTGWETVSLPHNWMIAEGETGGGYFYGPSTYRKMLNFMSIEEGKRYYLQFEGASLKTKVYLNGNKLGEHQGGFSTFRFDMTDDLKVGDNTLVVEVDNTLSDQNQEDPYAPIDNGADFNWWGGIYRDVSVIEAADVSIDLEDFGGPGVYLSQKAVTDSRADVEVAVHVRNKSTEDFSGKVLIDIKDATDKRIETLTIPAEITAGDVVVLTNEFSIETPHLWHGLEDPYLYQVDALLVGCGKVVDTVVQPLGLRRFEFDSDAGFILNGAPYPLRGVAIHQDYKGMGWATTWEQRKESIDIVHEMGANTIRFSHYPHSQDTQDYSDQLGFINWVEIPLINSASLEASYLESAKQQLAAMIKQNYNHPSVGIWGVDNEIMTQKLITATDDPSLPDTDETAALIKALSDYAHEIDGDAYRKTVQASVFADPIDSSLHLSVDVNAYNRYDGWYIGSTSDVGPFLDAFLETHPDRIVGLSEYGVGVSPYWHTDSPVNQDHSEQYSQYFHEQYLKQILERPQLWGTHVWNMFDFAVASRDEGDTKGRNDKGLVTYDRQVKKDAFYLYQAAFSGEPMVHIASKRQMDECPTDPDLTNSSDLCGPQGSKRIYVKAYSNLDELALYVDGVEIATKNNSGNGSPDVVFEWDEDDGVAMQRGESYEVVVRGEKDGHTYSDSYTYHLKTNESNTLLSSEIAILFGDDDTAGIISQLSFEMTLGQLLDSLIIPVGATLTFNGAEIDSDGTSVTGDMSGDIVEHNDVLAVTSESGVRRDYTIITAATGNLSFARNVADNGIKRTFIAYDNTQHLTDGNDGTFWAAAGVDVPFCMIDLRHAFYIDEVELRQGADGERLEGAMDVQVQTDTNVVDRVDRTDITTVPDGAEPYVWKLDDPVIAINVRLEFTDTEKALSYFGRQIPVPSAAQVIVYGGMIHSDTLTINYRTHTIDFTGIGTVADLKNAIRLLPSEYGSFELNVLDGDGNPALDTATPAGCTVEVLRFVGDLTFREAYNIPVP